MTTCTTCQEPLSLVVDEENTLVPDDLLLPCGCHFHWQCLLDEADVVASAIACPSCHAYLSATPLATPSSSSVAAGPPAGLQILTRYLNEGGLQENYDIYPDVAEEAYLIAHPEARQARAFLTMCATGDVLALVSLLDDGSDEEEMDKDERDVPRLPPDQLLRYQDPLDGLQSALHVAVENEQEEVVYMLLYLASRLPLGAFPADLLQSAQQIGLARPASVATLVDIRSLQDQRGDTAEAYAVRKGGQWAAIAASGLLRA